METNSFINLLATEIDRATTSIDHQTHSMNNIIEKSSNIVLQMDEFVNSKRKASENDIKYSFNRETIQELVKIAEDYSTIMSANQESNAVQSEYLTRSNEFANFQENVSRKKENLVSYIRRFQALKDNIRNMQTDLNAMTEVLLLIPNYADSTSPETPNT